MKLHFLGANRQVTGSRYCLEIEDRRVLVDCGMFQERKYLERNWNPPGIDPSSLTAVLLTHAHIDHCGLLPRLVRQGFRGPIYCTPPTRDLVRILLLDSARIQQEDVSYKRKRHRREGRQEVRTPQPLFVEEDVEQTLQMIETVDYEQSISPISGLDVTFHDAGHILGSAMLRCRIDTDGHRRTLLFSGDMGQCDKPLLQDPTQFEQADFVVLESTYGDRDHDTSTDVADALRQIIRETIGRGGNLVIPTFAVERAQELMYYIGALAHDDQIPDVHVFLDSPMAIDVTEIFRRHRDFLDDDAKRRILAKEPPLRFPGLQFSDTVRQSQAINLHDAPCVIMSTSGMCEAGRIKHHLRRNIERPESTILFVGYQGRGTLGRQILDRSPQVRIHGRLYEIRAEIRRLYGFSAHADRGGLLKWIETLRQPPKRIFLTHGDEDAAESLRADILRKMPEVDVQIPGYESAVALD